MSRRKFRDEQIAMALQQAEQTSVGEMVRRLGVAPATFYRWKIRYGGMIVSEVRKLKILEDENRNLKQLVADLSLDKKMLQDVLSKKV